MNEEENPSFEENELSEDDLAVLRAFEAMDDWEVAPSATPPSPVWTGPAVVSSQTMQSAQNATENFLDEEMLLLFVAEVEEDIEKMRWTLNQLEQDDQIHPARFVPLKRAAHKIRGTAGAVEHHTMATIAHYVEIIVEQIGQGTIFPILGVNALVHAVTALETTLESIVEQGNESETSLAELEAEFKNLGIHPEQAEEPSADVSAVSEQKKTDPLPEDERMPVTALQGSSLPLIRVDARRIDQLHLHSERLTERLTALENAQAQVEIALQELHAAQTRLQQLEPALSSMLPAAKPAHLVHDRHASSLIARILHESSQRNEPHSPPRSKPSSRYRSRLVKTTGSSTWDELDMERYNEKDMLIRSLREAIADISVTSSRVRIAFAQLERLLQEDITQATAVRNDILLLRLTPLSTVIPRLQQAITMSAGEKGRQGRQVHFEVSGETTEIDQDILEALTNPLLQLLRTCIADTFSAQDVAGESYRIWFHARGSGNEIALEIGFSMTVQGGAVEAVREPIQRLNGSISLQRNAAGGVSFHLLLPRSHSAAHCLLVRVSRECVIVPFSQVQRIGDMQRERLDIVYRLKELLDIAPETGASGPVARIQPVLVMSQSVSRKVVGIAIDEVLGEIELAVKPLTPYLQRPGIAGTAVDGKGKVLLMIDLPELISHYMLVQRQSGSSSSAVRQQGEAIRQPSQQLKILVADDSVYLRQSLLQMLTHAKYDVQEARDGMEALEQLLENTPDVFLLDVEMPNLNGYDVLNIMHLYPELAEVKVIMLTSRSSEKHIQRARELGAHAYLTKPCPQDVLLEKIRELFVL